ncbi:hypothetical protein ACFL5O_04415 [Myxococcota bacterium]
MLSQSHDIRSRPAVVPLTATETAELKEHLTFLRQNRKLLKLRVNAQEDLLLNGVREPTDRGVCQHLLAKVELSRVAAVAERLDPVIATNLLGGIVRFTRDVGFLLLYLESVQRSSGHFQATATLAAALRRMDFAELSALQLKRVLDLIMDAFDDRSRPEILLGLLCSKSFRHALDSSSCSLLPAQVEYLTALQAIQAVMRGAPNPHGPEALRRGAALILHGNEKALARQPAVQRQRVFELGLALSSGSTSEWESGLRFLWTTFGEEPRLQAELGLRLAGHLLTAQRDDEARHLLHGLAHQSVGSTTATHWLEALSVPRLGRVALVDAPDQRERQRGPSRFRLGFWLDRQRRVLVAVADPSDATLFCEQRVIWSNLLLPGVAPVILQGETDRNLPYLVVPHCGLSLMRHLTSPAAANLDRALLVGRDACLLLMSLAGAGIGLPDSNPARFAVADHGCLWLFDLCGCSRMEPALADRQHLRHGQELMAQIGRRLSGGVWPQALAERMTAADCSTALARILCDYA